MNRDLQDLHWMLVIALVVGLVLLIPVALAYIDLGFRLEWQSPTHYAIYGGIPTVELGALALLGLRSKHRLRDLTVATWLFNSANFLAVAFLGVFGIY